MVSRIELAGIDDAQPQLPLASTARRRRRDRAPWCPGTCLPGTARNGTAGTVRYCDWRRSCGRARRRLGCRSAMPGWRRRRFCRERARRGRLMRELQRAARAAVRNPKRPSPLTPSLSPLGRGRRERNARSEANACSESNACSSRARCMRLKRGRRHTPPSPRRGEGGGEGVRQYEPWQRANEKLLNQKFRTSRCGTRPRLSWHPRRAASAAHRAGWSGSSCRLR